MVMSGYTRLYTIMDGYAWLYKVMGDYKWLYMVIRGAFSGNYTTRQPTNYCRSHMLIPRSFSTILLRMLMLTHLRTRHTLSLSLGTLIQGINIP